jgi:ATP-dependent DNA helicase RecQ
MRLVYGIGEVKLREFGDKILQLIQGFCRNHNLATDVAAAYSVRGSLAKRESVPRLAARPNPLRDQAFDLFRQGAVIEDVMHQTGRSRPTVVDYLCEFIRLQPGVSISTWLADDVYQKIAAAARQVGMDRLKPIFIALEEKVPYDEIRIVVTFLTREKN